MTVMQGNLRKAVVAIWVSAAMVGTGGLAMGDFTKSQQRDMKIPTDLNVRAGLVAPGDQIALPAGHVRLYVSEDIRDTNGLPEVVQEQAALMVRLAELPQTDDIQDITVDAAAQGVLVRDLDQVAFGMGKRALSNTILGIAQSGGVRGFFLSRISEDVPDAAVIGVLYCFGSTLDLRTPFLQTYLEGVAPSNLIQIKEHICRNENM